MSHPPTLLKLFPSDFQGPLNGAGHVCRARNLIGREPQAEDKQSRIQNFAVVRLIGHLLMALVSPFTNAILFKKWLRMPQPGGFYEFMHILTDAMQNSEW